MSEKKFGKRLLTWALVAVMMISALPLNALADFEEELYAPQEETGEEQYGISTYANTYSVSISKGVADNCTIWYSESDGVLHELTGTISRSNLTGGYGIVFFVAPAKGYALTNITGDGKTFNSIVYDNDPTECDFWSRGNKDNLKNNGRFSDETIKSLIKTAKEEKGCVAAFLYTRTGNGDGGINATLNFYTEKLATVKKEAVAAYSASGADIGLSNVSIGDTIKYKLTVTYNPSANAVQYSNIKLTDTLTGDVFTLEGPTEQNGNREERYADYTVRAEDIKNEQIVNKAELTYDYVAKFNASSGSADDEAAAEVNVVNLVSYSYTGSVLPDGASEVLPVPESHKMGEPVKVASVPQVEGYTFSGWHTVSTTIDNDTFIMPATNVIFTGSWTANTDVSYTVRYVDENGTEIADTKTVKDQTFGTTVKEFAETVSGYTPDAAEKYITLDAYNKELVFHYRTATVTVTFDANGGSWDTTPANYVGGICENDHNIAYKVVDKSTGGHFVPVAPTRKGYDFVGWYSSAEGEEIKLLTSVFAVGNEDMTFVAHWTEKQGSTYTVVYTDGLTANKAFADQSTGGLSVGAKTPAFVGTPERSGYVFIGWTPAVADKVAAPANGGTVITYTATWEVDNWNSNDNTETGGDGIPDKRQALVKFLPGDPNGTVSGKTTQVITLPEGAESVKLGEVEGFAVAETGPNEGFRFNVWTMNRKSDETADEAATAVSPVAQSVRAGSKTTFFAHFEQLPANSADVYYTVTYTDGVGGSAFADQSSRVKSGEATPAFSGTLSRAGYRFLRWEPTVAATVTGDVTYTAQWEQIKYTIKWVDEGNSRVHKEVSDVPHGTTAEAVKNMAPENPTKASDGVYKYTFIGWLETYEDVTGHQVYTAQYSKELIYTPGPVTPVYPSVGPSVPPTVEIEDDDALGLNTTDHFAYIIGYPDGTVQPGGQITRAEVATIFFRLLTDDVREENFTRINPYSDVAGTAWYNNAVSTLSAMGIITGYPDGTFRPNASITRAEFAAIAARFDNDGDKTTAAFSDIANHWAKDEISVAYNNGWVDGYPDGTFGPQRSITRAETMTLVNRVLNRKPETEDDLLPDMVTWTDNADKKAWYYLAVQEATNSHYYEFKTNSEYEKWTELRENRDWSQLEK